MKPEDLRIKNLFEYDGKIFKVKEIRNYIIVGDRGKGDVEFTIKEIKPIELTEEWLLKMGFERHDNGSVSAQFSYGLNPVTHDYLIYLIWIKDSNNWKIEGKPFYLNGHFEIKTVNQLQNLFFALTGQELTIKEQK